MGFVSTEDQNRAIKDIILRQHRSTPDEMGRGREALVNGIEACKRADTIRKDLGIKTVYRPEVYLGAHPSFPDLFCIADNGCGMTFNEAERHLASIGCSGNAVALDNSNEQNELYAMDTNKGVGVKISLLPDNPGGLDYVSATLNGSSTSVCWFKLGMDQENMPGFFLLNEKDGYQEDEVCTSVNLDWKEQKTECLNFKHIQKAGHGTVLTLYGQDRSGNEETASNGATFLSKTMTERREPDNDYSLLRWINCRFWSFDDVKVSVNLGKETRRALGAEWYLKKAKQHGTVQLLMDDNTPVDVHWWIMPQDQYSDVGTSKSFSRNGHVAVKYKGELYWDPRNIYQTTKKHLKAFGIYSGWNAIVIYIDFDSLPAKVQKTKIATNESRTKLFYNRDEFEPSTANISDQFVDLIRAEDESIKPLIDYMQNELPPQEDSKESDEELKKLLRSLQLFAPLDKSVKQSLKGNEIGAGEPEARDIKPEHKTTSKIQRKRAVAPILPKGKKLKGIEGWDNDLPYFTWSDDINPPQSVSYSHNRVEAYTQCDRFKFLLESTLKRVQGNVGEVPEGVVRQTSEKYLKEVVKMQILSYIFVTAGFARSQKTSFQVIQRSACDETILESQLMLNASVQDKLTKTIQQVLING